MFHWYKLANRNGDNKLICDEHDQRLEEKMRSVSSETKRKWFILGLIETIPLMTGMIGSALHQFYFPGDVLLAGAVISLVIIAVFRNKTPQPPISLKSGV